MAYTAPVLTVRYEVNVVITDANNNVVDRFNADSQKLGEITAESNLRRNVRVQEFNVALASPYVLTTVADGLQKPSVVAGYFSKPVYMDLNNLGTAVADQPYVDFFILGRRDGGDCQVDVIDFLNPGADALNVNDSDGTVIAAGKNT